MYFSFLFDNVNHCTNSPYPPPMVLCFFFFFSILGRRFCSFLQPSIYLTFLFFSNQFTECPEKRDITGAVLLMWSNSNHKPEHTVGASLRPALFVCILFKTSSSVTTWSSNNTWYFKIHMRVHFDHRMFIKTFYCVLSEVFEKENLPQGFQCDRFISTAILAGLIGSRSAVISVSGWDRLHWLSLTQRCASPIQQGSIFKR